MRRRGKEKEPPAGSKKARPPEDGAVLPSKREKAQKEEGRADPGYSGRGSSTTTLRGENEAQMFDRQVRAIKAVSLLESFHRGGHHI